MPARELAYHITALPESEKHMNQIKYESLRISKNSQNKRAQKAYYSNH